MQDGNEVKVQELDNNRRVFYVEVDDIPEEDALKIINKFKEARGQS